MADGHLPPTLKNKIDDCIRKLYGMIIHKYEELNTKYIDSDITSNERILGIMQMCLALEKVYPLNFEFSGGNPQKIRAWYTVGKGDFIGTLSLIKRNEILSNQRIIFVYETVKKYVSGRGQITERHITTLGDIMSTLIKDTEEDLQKLERAILELT